MSFEDIVGAWAGGKPWSPQIDDWTRRRNTALPKLLELITGFETETVSLAEFSQSLDSFSKSTPLWGFSGFSGQMFLNVLMRAADQGRLADELRIAIAQPVSEHEADGSDRSIYGLC